MPTLPRKRYVHRVPPSPDQAAGRMAGLCIGCGEPYKPRVYEDICVDCVQAICADPDVWWDRMVVSLKMFDNVSSGHHHGGGRGNGH